MQMGLSFFFFPVSLGYILGVGLKGNQRASSHFVMESLGGDFLRLSKEP